jgi:hypothetical protein
VWIEPRFNLSQLVGRSIRLRYIFTSIEVNPSVLVSDPINTDGETGDDGWWVDDVTVEDTITSAATLISDATNNGGLPACGVCTTITPSLTADNTQLAAPGQIVTLDASGSTVDVCSSGVLQFRFWEDLFSDGILTPGVDPLLRDWLDNAILLDAPDGNIRYAVEVRCSSATSCGGGAKAFVTVGVTCPGLGGPLDPGPFGQTIRVSKGTDPTINLTWTTAALVDAIRGNLTTLRSNSGNFGLTVEACINNNTTVNSVADSTSVAAGAAKYYMIRIADPLCNKQGTWSTGTAGEVPGRNTETNSDSDTCP